MNYPSNDLRDSVSFPIYLCSKEIIRKYNKELAKENLTYTQFLVLMYFYQEKESNLKRVGKVLMLDSSTLTPLLKKLEKKGFVTRVKSTKDERNLDIKITKKGEDVIPRLNGIKERILNIINLSDEELNTLREITTKAINNIAKEDN